MIPAQILQDTQHILSNMAIDKARNIKCLEELERSYRFEREEIFSAIKAVKYGEDQIQSNGNPDDRNIFMVLQLDKMEKKYHEEIEPLLMELERIEKLTAFICGMKNDSGKALRWFYIGWNNDTDGIVEGRRNGAKLHKGEIGDELCYDRFGAADILRQGERECAEFLIKNRLLF